MVWHSSGENRAARMRGHIPVVIARHPVGPLPDDGRVAFLAAPEGGSGASQGLGFPAFSPDQILLW
jgi:hypothetical protein